MEIMQWRPFGQLSPFRREKDKLWDSFFNDSPLAKTFTEEWLPSVDVSETEDKIFIKADLPGLDTKDVNVSISGDVLMIKGEKKKEAEEKDEHHHRWHHHIHRVCGWRTVRSFWIAKSDWLYSCRSAA